MYQNNLNNYERALDAMAVLSLILGVENLQENIDQTAYNDIHAANDKQLQEIQKMIDKQNQRLEKQDKLLEEILWKLDKIS